MSCFYGSGSIVSILAQQQTLEERFLGFYLISTILYQRQTFLRSEGVRPRGIGHLRSLLLVTLETRYLDGGRGAGLSTDRSSASVFLSSCCCFSHLPLEWRCERSVIVFVSTAVTSFPSDDRSLPDGAVVASSCSD